MQKVLCTALLAVLAVVIVPAATANTSTTSAVSITNAAFVPKSVTIQIGDSVRWTNNSTVTQQVSCAKCSFTSPVLNAGASYTYTFKTAGNFPITDPLHSKIKGTVIVNAGPTVTLSATPAAVVFGGSTALSGKISSDKSPQSVEILGKDCGQTVFTHVATTTTSAGKYSVTQAPTMNTAYEAKWATTTSAAITVHVRPRIALAKIAPHKFRVRVKAATSFVGKTVVFRKLTALGWVQVKLVTLKTASIVGATTITKATFRSKIRPGRKVRITMPSSQAAPCYIGGRSNVIVS